MTTTKNTTETAVLREYRARIDCELSADTPEEAAQLLLSWIRDNPPVSWVVEVIETDNNGDPIGDPVFVNGTGDPVTP